MLSLDHQIDAYTALLQDGKIQAAYRGVMDFMGKLRSDMVQRDLGFEVSGNLYQGYMDMTYFSVNTAQLKVKGLKIAIVYLHEKKTFEVWLSARNRTILKKVRAQFEDLSLDGVQTFHDETNEDAAIESVLTASPNFDDQDELMKIIEKGVGKFTAAMSNALKLAPKL